MSDRAGSPGQTRPNPARPEAKPRRWALHGEAVPERPPRSRHPRLRPEPDRPGDRVRLLLRARRDDRARARPRRGDGQLQPGDGLDRLRHLRPPLLRAAHRRGRAGRLRDRAAGGRDRPVRRPDAAAAREVAGGGRGAAARDAGGRDRPGRGPRPLRGAAAAARDQAPALRHGALGRGGGGDRRGRRLPAAGPPLLRARRQGDGDLLRRRGPRAPTWRPTSRPTRSTRCCSTASWRTRSRSTSTRSPTERSASSPGSCSTSRRPASTPATRPA